MAPNDNPSDLEFLVSCIRNGEVKIDFTRVNAEHGWTNRSKSQIKYKNILKAHGLEITGNERYKKSDAEGTSAHGTSAGATSPDDASAVKGPAKRKAERQPAATKKVNKKGKTGNAEGTIAASGD